MVDIAETGFDPGRYGLTQQQVQAVMHVVLPDGRIARRIDAVRLIYGAIGLGWLAAPLGWPGLHWLFDRLYGLFARNRMRIGRLLGRDCTSDACGVHGGKNERPGDPPSGLTFIFVLKSGCKIEESKAPPPTMPACGAT